MTPDEFRDEIAALAKKYGNDDPETWHVKVDQLKDKVLRELGYGEGVDIWDQYGGWYA